MEKISNVKGIWPNVRFTLQNEHLLLMKRLSFGYSLNTEYDDLVIPTIERKRPFGNSDIVYDVCEILSYDRNEVGSFSDEKRLQAIQYIIELPIAMCVVFHYQKFDLGEYELPSDMISVIYYRYTCVRNYIELQPALQLIKEQLADMPDFERHYKRLNEIALTINKGDNPIDKLLENLYWYKNVPDFVKKAIEILERYKGEKR